MTSKNINEINPKDRLMVSISEAAMLMSISRSSLYAMIAAERLRSRIYGRRRLVEMAEIQRIMASLPQRREAA